LAADPLAPAWLERPGDANALDPAVWSRNAARTPSGELRLGGVGVQELAEAFGTPLYVLDESDVRSRAEEVRGAFQREFARIGTDVTVYYAAKAFLCTEMARWMIAAGLNIDVASGGELAVALAAGAPAERLGFHGNNKSLAEIDRAVASGVGVIVIDSETEIGRIAEAARRHGIRQAVRLRVNTGVHAHTHEYLATAREDQKFGIAMPDAAGSVAEIRSRSDLRFLGLHAHIGSQIFDAEGFTASVARLMELHALLLRDGEAPELNLGGGFGIPYTSADDAMPIGELARRLADAVAAEAARRGVPIPHLAVEPGRVIVGPSTTTLYRVGTVKDVEVLIDGGTAIRKYISVDGGMSDNVRPALYGADYSVRLAGRVSAAEPALVRVAGKHCESGDIVVHADYLPGDVQPDDLVAVPATGAYCWSLASNYNYLARPPVVAVRDGAARVIVRGETEEDLLSRDAGIARPGRAATNGAP